MQKDASIAASPLPLDRSMLIVQASQIPFWTALAAAAATVTALVTMAYTWLTLRQLRAISEPKVIVYIRPDIDRPSLLLLVIENIGRDVAQTVSFTPSRPLPQHAWGISGPEGESQPMQFGPLVTGIPTLGPGGSRIMAWGQHGGLAAALGREPVMLEIRYRHGKRNLHSAAMLEVESFRHTDSSDGPHLVSARALKSLAISAQKIAAELEKSRRAQDDGRLPESALSDCESPTDIGGSAC